MSAALLKKAASFVLVLKSSKCRMQGTAFTAASAALLLLVPLPLAAAAAAAAATRLLNHVLTHATTKSSTAAMYSVMAAALELPGCC